MKIMSRRVKSGVAAVSVTALFVGIPAIGAQADSQTLPTSSLANPSPASSAKPADQNELDVVVGETVAVTTNQKGDLTPFNLYLINGQVSGNGSGELKIPTGSSSTETKNLTSTAGSVSNFLSIGGTFNGDLPVTATTSLKVNGQSVDPDKGYNLNGDVEITYTVVNHTSRDQRITYTNLYGVQTSKVVNVPVPFGDSFSVTFGDGWDIYDAGAGSSQTTGKGTAVSATLILFPIIEGVAGGTTQTLTIKAKAQNASLPNTKHTIVPVPLNLFEGGVALQLDPMLENKILSPLNNTVAGAMDQIIGVANLISGYTSGFTKLNSDYIDPMVTDINKIKANPTAMTRSLQVLSEGLIDLGQVLNGNAEAKDDIAVLLTAASRLVGQDLEGTVEWLGGLIASAGPQAAEAGLALASIATVLNEMDPAAMVAANQTLTDMCSTVGPTTDYYGGQGNWLQSGGTGYAALANAISKGSGQSWKTGLQQIQTALNTQATGSLIIKDSGTWNLANSLMPAGLVKDILLGPACTPTVTVAGPIAAVADTLAPIAGEAALGLELVAAIASSPEAKRAYEEVLGGLTEISGLLSKPGCSNAEVITPIVNALQQYGVSGLEDHAMEIIAAIFKNCGLAQIMSFFGDVDRTLADVLTEVGDLVANAEKDVPAIAKGINSIKSLATVVGDVFDSIPLVGDKVGKAITDAALDIEGGADDALAAVSDFGAQLQASLVAMNDRGLAGDGAPYGNAYLADGSKGKVRNLTAYQITTEAAAPYQLSWGTSIALAVVFILLAVGVGTFLFRRRIRP